MELNNERSSHVSSADKLGKNTRPPSKPISTTESQSMAYVTLRNIESETSIQEPNWSIFILKELSDNAFDWINDNYPPKTVQDKELRKISVRIWMTNTKGELREYSNTEDTEIDTDTDRFVHIAVRNSNVNNIPAFQNLDKIFDFNAWHSTKRNQHRMTTGSLGDALKRCLGMGYASWTKDYDPDESFEDKQWIEPLIIRVNGLQFHVFIKVDTLSHPPIWPEIHPQDKPTRDIGNDTEVEVTLPIINSTLHDRFYINRLLGYYKDYKLGKSRTSFSITLNNKEGGIA